MKTLEINSYYSDKANKMGEFDVRFHFGSVYLHGEVERLCGYDICYPANPHDFEDSIKWVTHHFASGDKTYPYLFLYGIYPCIVDGKYYCTAFLWYDVEAVEAGEDHAYMMRGLIVLNSDYEAMEDARAKYAEKKMSI